MADNILEKIARVIAATVRREEAGIIRKKRDDRAQTEAIYAAYQANPTPETLKGLISLNEQAHEHAKIAQVQLENHNKMAISMESIIQNLDKKEKTAQAKGITELASALSFERGHYELCLSGIEQQQEAARRIMEQVRIAVERSDTVLEREKARVAAQRPPKADKGEEE